MTTQERKDRIGRLVLDIVARADVKLSHDELRDLIDAHFPPADGRNAAGQVVEYLKQNQAGQTFNLVPTLDATAVVTAGGGAQLGKTHFVPFAPNDQSAWKIEFNEPTTTTQTKP